ncbi:MAG TPA: UDP-N-acetylmuramoyl-L-alanine--D-glutamate ligase [Pseudonocardiaceae bacterium]|jgi:UDP-N-acetylmuramoylalanine--D-glutamate ligase|nr:UDP-N-acetylmuramoyl-L-alanine--D-glutamate ligase [Pseudonocardiaceae bacterium]
MRPTISWSDLPGRSVGLYGLGREGQANLRKCVSLGVEPILVDDSPSASTVDSLPVLRTASGGREALGRCDIVVKSPGISRYGDTVRELEASGVAVVGGLGLWLREADRSRILCVTGTKGKSTTTAIAAHLLNRLGYRAMAGGNLGVPPYDPTQSADSPDYDFWIIEVSSYQATDLSRTPPVFAVTSLHPDHLPWHGNDAENYFRDKLSACSQPGADLTIANGDSELLRERAALLGPRVRWVSAADDPAATWIEPLGLLGAHNRRNALIAREGLRGLNIPEADDEDALRAAAEGFAGLENRLRPIGAIDGVTFVDDSLSTNVLPTLAAVDAFPRRRIALIVGGHSRGIDYAPLAEGLRSRTDDTLVITVPDNGPDIYRQVAETGAGPRVAVTEADDLTKAVIEGYHWARPDGVVLLSPAAASFGQFRDYRERGTVFAAAMETCRHS